jgi:hypothetical protein
MTILFTETFFKQIHLIFDLYDFDKDGLITKQDVKIIFSNLPVHSENLHHDRESYFERNKLEKELHKIMECFGECDSLDLDRFINIVENKASEIFVYVLLFLMQSRPFTKETLEVYKEGINLTNECLIRRKSTLIAIPHDSDFAPITVANTPHLCHLANRDNDSSSLGNLSDQSSLTESIDDEHIHITNISKKRSISCVDDDAEEYVINKIPIIRKHRNTLTELDSLEKVIEEYPEAEEILPANIHSNEVKDEEICKLRNE